MEYKGIVITGTSGAGKSTVAQKFCENYKKFQIVQAVTTRKTRGDDISGRYQYMTEEEFRELDKEKKLLIKSEYRKEYYGITHEALQQVIDNGKIPLLLLTPKAVSELEGKRNRERYAFFTVFLDAPDDILEKRLERRGEEINENMRKQREKDRGYAKSCLYTVNNGDDVSIEYVAQLIYYVWSYRNIGGMLPKKMIELMIKCGMLLENSNLDNIQGASYDLVVGDEYFQKGEIEPLNAKKPFIVMEPGDYVLVSSKEIANLPKDIAARFDLTVSLFCKGVILSNGPQIDPGFRGKLFCLLFNTSNEKVQLKRGEHFATIEFVKLIEPTTPYAGKYQSKLNIQDYLPLIVKASAINELVEDVKNLKKEKLWIKILPIVVSIFALILAILALLIGKG
jgi:deoxycytidine triphosphate deaminase